MLGNGTWSRVIGTDDAGHLLLFRGGLPSIRPPLAAQPTGECQQQAKFAAGLCKIYNHAALLSI
jgi:hypothetical protein